MVVLQQMDERQEFLSGFVVFRSSVGSISCSDYANVPDNVCSPRPTV